MSGPLAPVTGPITGPAPATGIGADTSRQKSKANLDAAGERFEAVFVGMMLKSMRAASLGSDLFESKALDTFRDMQDGQVAKAMSEHAPLGIGRAMTDFLAKSQPDVNPEPSQPSK